MCPLEVAGGWLHGVDPHPMPRNAIRDSPRQVLDRILVTMLSRPSCGVAFSGGRDSSILLAATTEVARREGLPPPVAITLAYPGIPEAEESSWQERVLDHLGVQERVRIEVGDEHDPLGPVASPLLRRHGAMWPPNLAPTWRLMDQVRGGALIIGECGDEVFGVGRITPLRWLCASRGRPGRALVRAAALAVAPRAVRRRAVLRSPRRYYRSWLRAHVRSLLEIRDAEDEAGLPMHAGRNLWRYAQRRAVRRSLDTHRFLGREIGVDYVAPFGEPEFVSAVGRVAGRWGWTSRTEAMTRLFGDLLPDDVLHRTSKASFERAVFTERSREFARHWTGDGVDGSLVDPQLLQEMWSGDRPDGGTMALMQQAWLAGRDRAAR